MSQNEYLNTQLFDKRASQHISGIADNAIRKTSACDVIGQTQL